MVTSINSLEIEIMLKEYDALRQEILAAMSNRISILNFGIAAIGAIFTASIAIYTQRPSSLLTGRILAGVLPPICIFILFMWLGEYERMQRAGKFLVELELKINLEASKDSKALKEILTWETNLRKPSSPIYHLRYPYRATVLSLLFISEFSQVIGLTIMEIDVSIMWLLIIVGAIIHLAFYLYMWSRISSISRIHFGESVHG